VDKNKKTQVVRELKEIFSSTQMVIVTLNKGLTVQQSRDLRRQIKNEGNGCHQVSKNSLARIAMQDTRFASLTNILKGPTSLTYSDDPVAIAKVLSNFSKDNGKLEILGGVMDSSFLEVNAIKQLAALPSMNELKGKIVGLLCAPAIRLASILQAPAAQLARVLNAYAKKN
jgi:large subunit ribosomal protein L10